MTTTTKKLFAIGAVATATVVFLMQPSESLDLLVVGSTNSYCLAWEQVIGTNATMTNASISGWNVESAKTPSGPWTVMTNISTNREKSIRVVMGVPPGFYRVAALKQP